MQRVKITSPVDQDIGKPAPARTVVISYVFALLTVCTASAIALLMHNWFDLSNLIMVYLLGVVWTASRYGTGPSIIASLLSVAAFDFLFVPPVYSLTVTDSQYLVTFAVMLVTALLISTLTARVQEQVKLSASLAREAEAERLRNALLSSVSHDIRTPLATITGAASSLLANSSINPETSEGELVQVIYEEAERLERFTANLLSMSRLESGLINVNKEWQVLEEVVGAALSRMEERLKDKTIGTSLPPNLPLVPLDAVLIQQVIVNLIDNALKHSGAAPHIRISAQQDSDTVVVSVTDNGPGVRPTDKERVFDKFYRSTGSGSTGSGLGLTICKTIVDAHGGKIWVEDATPNGARFLFTLPISGVPPHINERLDQDE